MSKSKKRQKEARKGKALKVAPAQKKTAAKRGKK